jgi:hypothetical protein
MKRLTCEVRIGDYIFKAVHSVEINSSWDNLTDTAKISVPRKLQWQGKSVTEDLFKRGDKVSIKLGYDFNNKLLFEGFISAVMPGTPLTFQCEDAAWLLKQKTVQKYSEKSNISLQKMLKDICPIPFDSVDADLGQFKISKATVAQVLAELKKTYSLVSYVRAGKLYVGKPYSGNNQTRQAFHFQKNVVSADGLEFQRADDVKLRVKLISMLPDNKKIEVEVGDPDGGQRTLHYYNLSEAELRRIGTQELEKLKYDGYAGSFTAFGEPMVKHGDIAEITDKKYPERAGKYLIKSVTTTFGVDGYRQKIELDKKSG